jgi:hypothetical protein
MELTEEKHVSGCTGKRRYATAGDARQAIKKALKLNHHRLHKYYCENCEGYHLTSEPVSQNLIRQRLTELIKEGRGEEP